MIIDAINVKYMTADHFLWFLHITQAAIAPKSARRNRDNKVIITEKKKAYQKLKCELVITSLIFVKKFRKDTPVKLMGSFVMSPGCLNEFITTKKKGNSTYAATTIAINIFSITMGSLSFVFITIPPPSYLRCEPVLLKQQQVL